VGWGLAMARGLDCRFEKLPHARLRHSPHQCHGASLTHLKRRAAEVAKPLASFLCHKRAHKSQNQLTVIQVFIPCFLCLFVATTSLWLLFAHVVAMDIAIFLLAVLRFREDVFVVFTRHHSDAGRYVL